MLRTTMTSTIHRATVTQADLHPAGPVAVDADLLPSELVHLDGAAAYLVHPGSGLTGGTTIASLPA